MPFVGHLRYDSFNTARLRGSLDDHVWSSGLLASSRIGLAYFHAFTVFALLTNALRIFAAPDGSIFTPVGWSLPPGTAHW